MNNQITCFIALDNISNFQSVVIHGNVYNCYNHEEIEIKYHAFTRRFFVSRGNLSITNQIMIKQFFAAAGIPSKEYFLNNHFRNFKVEASWAYKKLSFFWLQEQDPLNPFL